MENPWMAKDYFCTDRVSKGTFGEVFKAFDSTTMEYIAIKVIPIPAPITKTTARRMHREVELLQELSSHPNIIQYLGHWTEGPLSQIYTKYVSGKSSSSSKSATSSSATSTEGATSSFNSFLFIQMEFANSNLEQWIASHAKRNSEACDEIILQLLAGLAFIHEKGIIHRDLKPKNILVITCTETIQAKIGDLGLARRNNIPETGISARNVGTKLYSSPELLQGKIYDERTDVFSLALIYLELLSNIDQDGKKILFQKLQQGYMPKSLGEQMNILPEWELLQKMLTYRKENRCSAQEALKSFNLLKQEKLTETDSDSGFGQSASGTEPQSTLISSWIQPKIPVLIKSQLLFVAGIVVTLFILYLWSASVTSEPAPFIPGVALDQGCVVDKRFYEPPSTKWLPDYQRPYNLTLYSSPGCQGPCHVYKIDYNACTKIELFHARSAWAYGTGCPGMALWTGNNDCSGWPRNPDTEPGGYHWIPCGNCVEMDSNVQSVKCP